MHVQLANACSSHLLAAEHGAPWDSPMSFVVQAFIWFVCLQLVANLVVFVAF
jgi:hypothetical protein